MGVQSGPPPPACCLPTRIVGLGNFSSGKDPELIPPPEGTPSEQAQLTHPYHLTPCFTGALPAPPLPQTPSHLLPPGVPYVPSLCLAMVLMPPSLSLPNKDLRGDLGLGDLWGVRGSVLRAESTQQQGQ